MRGKCNVTVLTAALVLAALNLGAYEEPQRSVRRSVGEGGFHRIDIIGMSLEWKIEEDRMDIVLTGPTEGYVAVGFEPTELMKDANILIGFVADDGSVVVRDDYATWFTSHEPDVSLGGENNAEAVSGVQENGTTRISFSIPLDSGDEFDKVLQPGETHTIIMSYGSDDDLGKRHQDRIKFELEL